MINITSLIFYQQKTSTKEVKSEEIDYDMLESI